MLIVYIPYILFYSPREILADYVEDEQEAFRTAVPGEDFGTGRIAPVIILMALFVDILLLSGVYKTYYLKTDLVNDVLWKKLNLDDIFYDEEIYCTKNFSSFRGYFSTPSSP